MKNKRLTVSLVLLPFCLIPGLCLWAQAPQGISETRIIAREAEQGTLADRHLLEANQRTDHARLAQDLNTKVKYLALLDQASGDSQGSAAVTEVDARTGTAIVTSGDGKTMRLHQIVSRARSPEQSQVIAFSAMDPVKRAEMTEDLNVMTKLIDDAVADQRETAGPRAMGINVTTLFSDGTTPRALFIESHGAIFQTAVRFPLKPTEKKEPVTAQKPAKNSPWDDARRDLYGGRDEKLMDWAGGEEGKPEEYSEESVESLKKSVLKALANANNFRHLGRDETVTVVIRSTSGGGRRVAWAPMTPKSTTSGGGGFGGSSSGSAGFGGGGFGSFGANTVASLVSQGRFDEAGARYERGGGAGEQATMTIRVKKSDADALAGGSITDDEFRKRATVAIY